MQLKPRDIPAFLANPQAYTLMLIYGPDEGLVRTRKNAILAKLGISRDDPFVYNEYDQSRILDEPSLLYESLSAMTLTGDTPCVTITGVTDKLTAHVKEACAGGAHNTLILTAGDLPKRSSLRSYCEDAKAKHIAAIPCYRDEGRGLEQIVHQFLQQRGIEAAPDVKQALVSLLGNDRAVTLSELEKIDLYLGKERRLTEPVVHELLTDNTHRLTGDAVMAFLTGDKQTFFALSQQAFAAGEHAVAFTRACLRIMRQLLEAKLSQAGGKSDAQAIEALRPMVFFRDKPLYIKALQRYTLDDLTMLSATLAQLELQAKSGKAMPELLVMQGLAH